MQHRRSTAEPERSRSGMQAVRSDRKPGAGRGTGFGRDGLGLFSALRGPLAVRGRRISESRQ